MSTMLVPGAEALALADFDRRIEETGCFRLYREVEGEIFHPRLGVDKRSVRIDRILSPTVKLMDAGWTCGPIGIEGKRPAEKIGKPISQLLDYLRSVFELPGGYRVVLEWGFLYPFEAVVGDLQSVMTQHRIGVVGIRGGRRVVFDVGGRNVISIDADNVPAVNPSPAGGKAGCR